MRQRITQQTTKVALSLPKMESAPELWLRNIRMSGFAFTVLALVIIAVIVLAPGLRILVEQQQQIAALTASVDAGETAVTTYQSDVARWSDPAYIEAQAREQLYYIFPGDRTYLVIDDGATVGTSDGQPISDSIQSLQVDWVQSLVSSLYTAGLTDATGSELSGGFPAAPGPTAPTVPKPPTTDGN
jgi:cell division protein FtsB